VDPRCDVHGIAERRSSTTTTTSTCGINGLPLHCASIGNSWLHDRLLAGVLGMNAVEFFLFMLA
jgi:hypothetical protein